MLRCEAWVAALGRFLKQKDLNDGVCLRRLDEVTARVAKAATSLLIETGGLSGECCVAGGRYIARATYGSTAYKRVYNVKR